MIAALSSLLVLLLNVLAHMRFGRGHEEGVYYTPSSPSNVETAVWPHCFVFDRAVIALLCNVLVLFFLVLLFNVLAHTFRS